MICACCACWTTPQTWIQDDGATAKPNWPSWTDDAAWRCNRPNWTTWWEGPSWTAGPVYTHKVRQSPTIPGAVARYVSIPVKNTSEQTLNFNYMQGNDHLDQAEHHGSHWKEKVVCNNYKWRSKPFTQFIILKMQRKNI